MQSRNVAPGRPEVVIYTTTFCPFCAHAKSLMARKGVSYEEINLDEQPQRRSEMISRAAGRSTVPQIFIDGILLGNCEELYALEASGKLGQILAASH